MRVDLWTQMFIVLEYKAKLVLEFLFELDY